MEPEVEWVMDAVKFLRAKAQMCRSYMDCKDCPLGPCDCETFISAHPLKAIKAVEKWAEAHRKTRQSIFLERYPNAAVDPGTGALLICPIFLNEGTTCHDFTEDTLDGCNGCQIRYWLQEVPE